MKLIAAHIRNFKLLQDVKVEFSTDPEKPLTVIRAENGSGKTSLLYALTWAFFGSEGLPSEAREHRLISSASPSGVPVDAQVMIEFENLDDSGISTRYRLIRTTTQTLSATDDRVEKGGERLRLLRISTEGEEDVDEAFLNKLLPLRLREIFFTNGEDVQTFISGAGSVDQRQKQVHGAIRSLLGLEALETAISDLSRVEQRVRQDVAKSAGADVEAENMALEDIEHRIEEYENQRTIKIEQLQNMRETKAKSETELEQIRGLGDLDALNHQIAALDIDISTLEQERSRALLEMKDLIRSEDFSWALLENRLAEGMKALGDLAERGVIPGASVEVLTDRLALELCICGESLAEGDGDADRRRGNVQHLIEEQRRVSETSQRLTGIWHIARQSKANIDARRDEERDFWANRSKLLVIYTNKRDALAGKSAARSNASEHRAKIDDSRVRDLVARIERINTEIEGAAREIGSLEERIQLTKDEREDKKRAVDEAERAKNKDAALSIRKFVTEDLLQLARGTLGLLEKNYVNRVGTRMADLFMKIVGSHPDFEAGVFTGVHIADNFDIIVDTHNGHRLDPAFELNGASQRALTLAFIWALMEVSATSAPRIIDTPLGMVAGGVKDRMVETITRPAEPGQTDSQVVLMLTRSEIRDIEGLLDKRAGKIITMSCSKDYPADLRFPWNCDHPIVRTCSCNHHQSCRVCARIYDDQYGVVFRTGSEES